MRLASRGRPHLAYNTGVHPAGTWADLRSNLERYVLAVKEEVCPHGRLGLGLHVPRRVAQDSSLDRAVGELIDFLRHHDLYVFATDGSPGVASEILAHLLRDEPDLEGSVSTVLAPERSRPTWTDEAPRAAERVRAQVANLDAIHERSGKIIALAVELAPESRLETPRDAIGFVEGQLLSRAGLQRFSTLTRKTTRESELILRRHLGVCLDACHLAVSYESTRGALISLLGAGIRVPKVQVSTGLKIDAPREALGDLRELGSRLAGRRPNQVVAREGDQLVRYASVLEAVAAYDEGTRTSEWRIHLHVPVSVRAIRSIRTTHVELQKLLDTIREDTPVPHLEIETYVWDVAPEASSDDETALRLAHELRWTIEEMGS